MAISVSDTKERDKGKDLFGCFPLALVTSLTWASLNPNAAKVYLAIVAHARWENRQAWPSRGLIAKEAGVSVKRVHEALQELVNVGLLKRWRKDHKNFYYCPINDLSLCPQNLDVRTRRKAPKRGEKGKFVSIRPQDMDAVCPQDMDAVCPQDMDAVCPQDMDVELNQGTKSENEKKERNQTGASHIPSNYQEKDLRKDPEQEEPQKHLTTEPGETLEEERERREKEKKERLEETRQNARARQVFDPETLHELAKKKGPEWLRDHLLKMGYTKEQILAALSQNGNGNAEIQATA